MCLFKVVMIIDECQEKMNCLYSLVNVSSVISDLSIFITGWGGGKEFWREHLVFRGNGGGIRYTYSTSNTPRPRPSHPAPPPPLPAPQYSVSRNGWFIFQQYLQRRDWNPVHSFEAQLHCKEGADFLKDLHHYGCFCGVTKEMRSYKDPSAVKEKDPLDG